MSNESINTNAKRSIWRLIVILASLILGLSTGVYFHGPISHLIGLHRHEQTASSDKQLWTCGMHPQVIQDKPGNCPICGMALEPLKAGMNAGTAKPTERKVKYYWDPMINPPYISSQPGKSPMGMDLVPVYEDEVVSGTVVQIDPVVIQNMGVRVATAERAAITRSSRVVGFLQEAQPNIREVSLRVSGWVEKLHANIEGVLLKKGEPLFDLYSPEIKVAIEELITSRRSLEALPANADAIARESANTIFNASREKLMLWGIDAEEVDQLAKLERAPRAVTFKSPITGNLVEKTLVEGTMVKMGERAMRIVDLSTLWLDAQVFAQDLPFVRVGLKVRATVESLPGKDFEGEVIFIHPRIDPNTRTATVRLALPNADLALRPGTFATAHIESVLTKDALVIPREAVIDTGSRQVAFVSTGGGHFEPRLLKTGVSGTDGSVQVLAGLMHGEQVVTSGQFLLDAESRMREAIQKHLNDKLLKKPGDKSPEVQPPITAKSHEGHSKQPANHDHPSMPVTQEWTKALDRVVTEYLKLARHLGEVQKSDKPLDVAALLASAKTLQASGADDVQRTVAGAIATATEPLVKQPLAEQRKAFKSVSAAVIDLVGHYKPSAAVGSNLYVLYCSMAEGVWLQNTDDKANPYYATSMKKCADVQRTLPIATKE